MLKTDGFVKGALKLYPKIIFVFTTKIGEKETIILKYYFSK